MSQQGLLQQSIRDQTETAYDYNSDWMALFDLDEIPAGPFNARLHLWIESKLGETFTNINAAMQAFAEDQGYANWSSMGAIVLGPSIVLSANTVAEDAIIGTAVGTASISGSYTGTPSWGLSGADAAKYAIDSGTGEITVADVLTAGTDDITIEVGGVTPAVDPRPVVITVTEVVTIDPVTNLSVASANTDTTPDLAFTLPAQAIAGDTIVVEYSVANADSWGSYFSHTLSSGDISSGTITKDGVTPISDGTYDFRVRVERSGAPPIVSDWTILEDHVIDTTAPALSSVVPADNATGIAIDADIVVTWDENIVNGSGTLTLKRTSDNATIDSWTVPTDEGAGAGQYSRSGGAATFKATSNRANGTEHYIVWDAGIFEDAYGNAVAAQASTTAYSFTTVSSFTEQGVVFDRTNDALRRTSDLTGAADNKLFLLFASVEFANTADANQEYILAMLTGANALYRNATGGTISCVWREIGGTTPIALHGVDGVGAERANILISVDADGTSRSYVWRGSTGSWSEQATDATGGGAAMDWTQGSVAIGSRDDASLTRKFGGTMYRVAGWIGVAPDITNASVRANFADATTGALVDPAVSIAAYGTPIVDFYGAASVWNAGTNNGSGGDFTMTGAVVDA